MAQRILALELVDEQVRAAAAERAWSHFSYLGAWTEPRLEGEEDLLPALLRVLERTGRPDIVLSALSGEMVAKRLLTLPFHDRRRLDQAVPFALEEHLPFSVEDAVVSFAPLARRNKETLVLAAWVRKPDVRAHLEFLARAGLDPKVVTLSALALSLLVRQAPNGATPCAHLLVNLDYGRTSIALLDESGVPRALRILPLGFEQSTEAADGRGNSVVALVRQTALAESATIAPVDVILSGAAAVASDVQAYLGQELALPVRSVEEIEPPVLRGPGADSPATAACRAMLLGELPTDPLPLINFRRGEFAFHGRTGDLTPFYASALLAAALLLMAVLDVSIGLVNGYRQLSRLDQQVLAVAEPVLHGVPAASIERTLAARIAQSHKRLRLLGGSGNIGSPLDTLLALSRVLPSRLRLDIDELSIDDTGLRITGQADSYATVDAVKRMLTQAPVLDDVQVTDERPGENSKIAFHLTATIRDSLAQESR